MRYRDALPTSALLLLACARPATSSPVPAETAVVAPIEDGFARSEHWVPSETGVEVFVSRVAPTGPARGAVVLMHGAGSPSSAVWDLPRGCSVQAALAEAGLESFAVDVRGFGGAKWKNAPTRAEGPPAVRAVDVMPDLEAAFDFVKKRTGRDTASLVGWSWGSVVSGMFAGLHPDRVDRLALFAPVYDRRWPTRHVERGAFRTEARALHMKWLDPDREDPEIRRAYVERLFRFVEGDELRLFNGPYRDVYGEDAPVWDPALVKAPTLVIRGSDDRASLRPHALALFDALEHAPSSGYLELSDAGHFAFRTRRCKALQSALRDFLADGTESSTSPSASPDVSGGY